MIKENISKQNPTISPGHKYRKNHSIIANISLYTILIIVSIICIIPFLFMFIASFKSMKDILSFPMPIFSTGFTFNNYVELFSKYKFALVTWNSFYVAVLFTIITVYISSMTGYALSKYNFKFKNIIFLLIIGSIMIPFESTMIPLYIIFKNLKLINSHVGIIIPQVARVAFGTFFMRQYISGLSSEYIESARIDGCTEFGIFHSIILPILKPAFATLGIIFFMSSWNNYLWPLIILKSQDKMTIPIALNNFQQAGVGSDPPYHLLMSGATISVLPTLVAFFSLQKYFIAGITEGAVKG